MTDQDKDKQNPEVPILFSNCTNWNGKPFMKVFDFLQKLSGDAPDFDDLAQKEFMNNPEFNFPEGHETTYLEK